MNTLLLDQLAWDCILDAQGNIAVASEPYSLSQDAASAIRTFLGECYFDVTIGVPYLTQVFGKSPSVALMKSLFQNAALTVPDVATAVCYINSITDRGVSGQVQVTSASTGQTSVAPFSTANPQGI